MQRAPGRAAPAHVDAVPEKDMQVAFRLFDSNGNGMVDAAEFQSMLSTICARRRWVRGARRLCERAIVVADRCAARPLHSATALDLTSLNAHRAFFGAAGRKVGERRARAAGTRRADSRGGAQTLSAASFGAHIAQLRSAVRAYEFASLSGGADRISVTAFAKSVIAVAKPQSIRRAHERMQQLSKWTVGPRPRLRPTRRRRGGRL